MQDMGYENEDEAQYRAQLNAAIRKRLLSEIDRGGGQSVVNNVYGGGVGAPGGGIREMMAEGADDPAMRDYYVDIEREDMPDINPATGKPKGWRKKVHRFSVGRGEDPEKKKGSRDSDLRVMTRDAWLRSVRDDIDPAKHAGESWFETEEYARPEDIENPYTRGEVGREGDYYPPPAPRRRR